MNYKLYALLFALTLAATPALQAMRLTRGLMATSRSLRPAIEAGKHSLAQTHSTRHNGHGYGQEEPRYAYGNYSIPAAVTAGVVLTAKNDLEEEDASSIIEKLDITDIKAVQEFLKNATIEQQQAIANAIAQNIQNYTSSDFMSILFSILNEQNKEVIIAAIAQNFNTLFEKHFFHPFLFRRILQFANDEAQDLITTFIAKNPDKFDPDELPLLLQLFNEKNKVIITTGLIINISDTFTQEEINSIYEKLIWFFTALLSDLQKESQKIVLNAILKKDIPGLQDFLTEQNPKNIATLMQHLDKLSPADLILIFVCANKESSEYIKQVINAKIDDFIGQSEINTQSTMHLKTHPVLAWINLGNIINDPKHRNVFQQAIRYERTAPENHVLFYHSLRSPIYWLQLLYGKLWEKKYNEAANKYQFLRFPDDNDPFSNAILQLDGIQKRTELINDGRIINEDELRPYLLFANYALFGNSLDWGSSSAFYYLNNFNCVDPDITTQTIVDKFGDQALFGKYKTEFEQLENEYKQIMSNSLLLQLSVPQKALADHVYLAEPGGYKKKLKIGEEETDNIQSIIHALRTTPEKIENTDQQEFCIVMTPDAVHKLREQGAEVRVYGDFDQEKLNALIARLETLIARMAQENPQTFSARMTPTQSYQAYKPVLDDLLQKKD